MAGLRAAVLVACLAALIQTSLAAPSHTVGGTTGWTIPTSNGLYSSWASHHTFKVGDTLVFNFLTGTHTVAEVTKSAYDACTTTSPISTATTGPASITLSTAGTHYYICTITGHCAAGQKLAVTAATTTSAAPSTSPATAPTPSSSSATAPTPSSATAPTPSSATAPTPSTLSPTTATSPATSGSVPSAKSPGGGDAAPAPSAAIVAGAGLVMPIMMVAAFLV